LLVHGWWNIGGAKMSKSTGNIVDPDALADKYSAEAVRYYLMSDIATGRDADFSEERLVQRYNADLANSLGNLLNRALSMAGKYRSGVVKTVPFAIDHSEFLGAAIAFEVAPLLANLPTASPVFVAQYSNYMDQSLTSVAVQLLSEATTACNQLVDLKAPWALAKQEKAGDVTSGENLDAVLYALAESLRILAILISPILPKAAAGIFTQLNWTGPLTLSEAKWGKLPDGHQLGEPKPLFPRIETAA
jgi:methionyl-tRNA synthetase